MFFGSPLLQSTSDTDTRTESPNTYKRKLIDILKCQLLSLTKPFRARVLWINMLTY